MKQMLRRITSLVMALLVLVSLLPLQSFATEADSIPPATTDETQPTDGSVQDQEETTDPTETAPTETVPYDPSLFQGIQSEDVEFYLLSTKTRSIVDKAVKKNSIYVGQTWYDVWYQNKWSGYWDVWGSWWCGDIVYFEFASGAIGYCIQPYNTTSAVNQDRYPITWDDIVTPYESCSDGFEESKAQGISLAMAYGAPNNGDTSVSGYYATAALIWAIGCGHIRPDGTIRDEETPFLKALKDGFWDDPECYAEIEAKYNELLVCLQNHGKIPSFSAGSRAELTDANTITLQYDASSSLYTASVTDTNGILKYFNYQSSVEGLTFEKSGNTLIVKATPAAVTQLGSSSIINSRGHEVVVGPDSVIVWNTEDLASQSMVTMNVAADPVPSYFTLAVPKGDVKIVKTTEDGKNLAGWQFGIYTDAACTTMIFGPHTSGSDGTITVSGLDVGTVWVKEIGHSDAAINALYQCNSTNPQQVTVQSGQTATVNFRNNLRFGKCQIIKTTTNGGNKAGWHFTVKDSGGKAVGTYITDATGIITMDLNPGTYTVTETDGAYKYWVNDPTPTKTVTVKAGETVQVTFTNQWRGQAQIIKTATNGGSVAGWHFEVKNSAGKVVGNYTTDATGIITLDLEPGTYTVTETDGAYKYWVNDPTPTKTVVVKAGQTAKVTFQNQWRGQAQIVKTATNGGSVSGWHFEVKNSSGTVVGNYVTDATGVITLDLEPGTYTVTETDGAYKYWVNDPAPTKTITVKAGETAKVTFTNQWRGQAQIVKNATNGGSVSGWHFEVKNSAGKVVGNYTTDATGIITLDLEPGTYTVTETDGAKKYWVNDPTPTKTVTVKAGETAKVTFSNQWRGQAQIVKTATNGGSVSGWHFTVKNSSGTVVGNYVTDATGIITLDLEPGTYTVTETDGAYKYWVNDPTPTKTVTVKAGETAKVTFTNQWRGQVQIVKTATNGGSVSGWHFIVKNSAGKVVGNYTTDTTGIITLDLEPGTYTVTETDGKYAYWHNDPNPSKTVTVKAGETASVAFQNQWIGKAEIIKTATNGGSVEGWEFTIMDADGNTVGTYTTDAAGKILVDLNPGTYTVQETDRQDPYWYCDTAPQTITVKAGETATVTFRNQWIGKAKIIKTLANPEAGTLKDWLFKITDASGKDWGTYGTDDTGVILLDLEPGTYTVTEILEADSLWQCTTENPQTITVEAGKIAEVTFTNALRSGEINIQKVNHEGQPLAGAEFLLEWSEDGINWHPVTYTDGVVISKGTCSSSGLQDGKLVSGADGLVVFTGLYPTLQYRLTETKAPDGYQLLQGCAYEGVLPLDGKLTVSLTVVNAPVFMLPETGSTDFFRIPLWTALCIWTGAGLLLYLRKRQGG